MITFDDAVDLILLGRAAVEIDGIIVPVTGIGRSDNGVATVGVQIGGETLELDLGPDVRFVEVSAWISS